MGLEPVDNKDYFVSVFIDYVRANEMELVLDQLSGVLADELLWDVASRLLSDPDYLYMDHPEYSYVTVDRFMREKLIETDNESDLGLYYDEDRSDGMDLIQSNVELQTLAGIIYQHEPESFLAGLKTTSGFSNIMANSMEAAPHMTPIIFVDRLAHLNPTVNEYQNLDFDEVVHYDKFFLAEHHIYGSSRLGIKSYLPTQYEFVWDASKTVAENQEAVELSQFNYRRPWYSHAYNALVGEAAHIPYGNVSKMPLYSNRVLGQKRYELTNHLGNVMAVVTDKITEEPATPNATLPAIGIRRASLFAAYDYYPFGMLMPNRYIEDESEQCTPVTRNIFTKQQISVTNVHFKAQADMGIFVPVQGTGLEFTISETDAPGKMLVYAEEGEDVSVSMLLSGGNVQAETEVRIQTQVSNHNYEMPMVVELRQQNVNTQEWEVITSQEMSREGFMELTGTAINSTPFKLVFSAGGYSNASFDVHGVDYYILDVVTHSYTYIECNRDQDAEVKDYRYSFGGHERLDEISGSANTVDMGDRWLDVRLGRTSKVDAKAGKYPSLSPYSYAANNPIIYIDPDGKEIDLSNLTAEQLTKYNAAIEVLSSSKLFSYYYQQLLESSTVYTIKGANEVKGRQVGGYFNSSNNEVGVGESFSGYVIAQELFHAFQKDGGFYEGSHPKPLSTIEAEGDIMTVYVMLESGGGFPTYGEWISGILNQAFESIPSSVEVGSEEYQKMFQKAVDDRIQYYKEQGMNTPTYTAPNTGEKPKALEATLKGSEQSSNTNDTEKE